MGTQASPGVPVIGLRAPTLAVAMVLARARCALQLIMRRKLRTTALLLLLLLRTLWLGMRPRSMDASARMDSEAQTALRLNAHPDPPHREGQMEMATLLEVSQSSVIAQDEESATILLVTANASLDSTGKTAASNPPSSKHTPLSTTQTVSRQRTKEKGSR